ncbi:DUF1877 family protein [Streptomyces sp. NPDC101490]|uniref:DUF1877 family protein n=1 Tax=Streptomyces sp. NPDC101490 TaxID=3366143 RepID=UPI00381AEF86
MRTRTEPPCRTRLSTRLTGSDSNGDGRDQVDGAHLRAVSSRPGGQALLKRSAFPVDIVHGEEPFTGVDDWGYGPPRYVTGDRVRLAAETLTQMTYDQLIQGVDHSELATAEIYPLIWDSPTSLGWARDLFIPLTEFFQAAASDGHAMVIWLD